MDKKLIRSTIERVTLAMDIIIAWGRLGQVPKEEMLSVRDFGIEMFRAGHTLGLSGTTYDEFQVEGKKINRE